ncbi:MAG: 23S rRNA (adenine(2503)-C(2))-methyltransferase RlmN [Clostridiales bacterium]|nr:23S rRNA (adenine(2503)-C(2))-methyltransferase RlmN [Clostridiales bacterium]
MNDRIDLAGMTSAEISAWCQEQGLPSFRGSQIFKSIHQGLCFGEMTNLPLSLREKLCQLAVDQPTTVRSWRESKLDGTVKFLFSLSDGQCVEGVLMRYVFGLTLCISTQVGCRMGCRFCASTLEGLVRNLTAGEMLGEILAVNRWISRKSSLSEAEEQSGPVPEHISRVVLMGSGEPLDNYEQVLRFLHLLREEAGVHISLRNVSLSTCGLVPKMIRFADESLPVTLCVSLHAPNDSIRKKMMPIAETYSIQELLNACRIYIRKTGRRIIFEYALTEGLNAGESHAEELARRLRGMQCHVNLIPLNSVPERGMAGVSEETVRRFLQVLKRCHISATRRREMGDDIEGACGQLRRKTLAESSASSGTSFGSV